MRHIYTTAVEALTADASGRRKFQSVEMIYFHQWWVDPRTTDAQRADARALVAARRLAFAVGGWVMPDEATTDYTDLIETMTAGHEWITAEFGRAAARCTACSMYCRVLSAAFSAAS